VGKREGISATFLALAGVCATVGPTMHEPGWLVATISTGLCILALVIFLWPHPKPALNLKDALKLAIGSDGTNAFQNHTVISICEFLDLLRSEAALGQLSIWGSLVEPLNRLVRTNPPALIPTTYWANHEIDETRFLENKQSVTHNLYTYKKNEYENLMFDKWQIRKLKRKIKKL
jgi:hypothetical protein